MRVSVDFKNFKPRNEFVDQMMGAISKWEQQLSYQGECKITITDHTQLFNFDFEFTADELDNGQTCSVKIRKADMHGMPRDWMIFVLVVYMDYISANVLKSGMTTGKTSNYTH